MKNLTLCTIDFIELIKESTKSENAAIPGGTVELSIQIIKQVSMYSADEAKAAQGVQFTLEMMVSADF